MAARIHIKTLKLNEFRNYSALALDLDRRHVVLMGDNGSGKTNLLEAVSFLSPGRGLRRAAYADVPRKGSETGFSVFAAIEGLAGPVEIGTGAGASEDGGGRRIRINGAPAPAAGDLLEHLRVLWLTPAMDGLFTGSAGDRRRFLDRLVLAIDRAHARRTVDYERAMRSRNRLLADSRADPVWLDGIEAQMAELGVAISAARAELVALLTRMIEKGQDDGAFPRADIAISGFPDRESNLDATGLEERFAEELRTGRPRDAAAGRTLAGPHRADLLIRHAAKDMEAAHSSTGEQKALLVGIVMAHARLVAGMTDGAPILLLDEVAAHLDARRRASLFDLVDALDAQAIMTGTDPAMFEALDQRAQFFTVSHGTVQPS